MVERASSCVFVCLFYFNDPARCASRGRARAFPPSIGAPRKCLRIFFGPRGGAAIRRNNDRRMGTRNKFFQKKIPLPSFPCPHSPASTLAVLHFGTPIPRMGQAPSGTTRGASRIAHLVTRIPHRARGAADRATRSGGGASGAARESPRMRHRAPGAAHPVPVRAPRPSVPGARDQPLTPNRLTQARLCGLVAARTPFTESTDIRL